MNFNDWVSLEIATAYCALKCVRCGRQQPDFEGSPDISTEDFSKICKVFKKITLNGIYGDPIYHHNLLGLIKIANDNNCELKIHTAGQMKSKDMWTKLFKASNATWIFALDGLPEESELYRVGQDGTFVWEIMKYGVSLGASIKWQYIPFSYNEHHIDEARQLAIDNGVKFFILRVSRWKGENDVLKPNDSCLSLPMRKLGIGVGFYPKCVDKNPKLIKGGYFVPCFCDKVIPELCIPKLNISNVTNIVEEIFESVEWKDFYTTINESPSDMCKFYCSYDWKQREVV